MNVNILSNTNTQLMNLSKLTSSVNTGNNSNSNNSNNTNTSNSSSNPSYQTTSAAPRFALSINNNVANINNALLRNSQLSPSQLKSSNVHNLSSKIGLGLVQQQNHQNTLNSNTISNLQNYTINLQNQINYAALNLNAQQQQQQQQQQQKTTANLQATNSQQNSSPLLAAASVLAANNLAAQMYQPMQTTCNLNNTLFVGNLHASLQEIDLIQVFRPFGRIVECCKKWLHFGFVKFTTEEEACHAYVTLNGFRLKGRPMRLEFQNRTKKARIKAILAQAALQAANGTSCNNDILSMGNVNIAGFGVGGVQLGSLGFPTFIDDRQQLTNMQNQQSAIYYQTGTPTGSVSSNSTTTTTSLPNLSTKCSNIFDSNKLIGNQKSSVESSFFNSDQLIKFASGSNDSDSAKDKQFEMNFDLTESNNYYDLNSADLPCISTSFDLKLNEDLMKDIQYSSLGEKKSINSNDDVIMSLIKKTISPSDSPTHDSLSLSSDSGCRSNSFLNDEDSAITSMHTSIKMSKKNFEISTTSKKKSEDCTISEHLEFTCSNSSPIKEEKEEVKLDENEVEHDADDIDADDDNDDDDCSSDCDTSDDASEIRSEADADSDCLNDLDFIDENFLNGETEYDVEETKRFNQVIEKDGSIIRKKLDSGIYKSINQTLSLFIEPHDVLKLVENDEFDEYSLFPNDIEQTVDSYLVIKNHFYIV